MTFCWWGADRPYDINSPCFEWPRSNSWMEQLQRLMYKVCMNLIGFTPLRIFDGISYHGWPIISKPVQSILELQAWLMSSAYAVMRLLKHFLCLRIREATEKDIVIWATVECLYYRIIVETEGPSSNRCCFLRVVRQYIMQSIVNEEKSPISWFKICWGNMDLLGFQHMFRTNKVSSSHYKMIHCVNR